MIIGELPEKDKYKNMVISWEERQEIERRVTEKWEELKKNPIKYELPEKFKRGQVKTEEEIAFEKKRAEDEAMLKKYGEMFPDSTPKDWYNSLWFDPDFPPMIQACIEKGIPMEELYPYEYDYYFECDGVYIDPATD